MNYNRTDERLLRHLRHKHCKAGLSPTDQFVVEPRRASVKPRYEQSLCDFEDRIAFALSPGVLDGRA